jgi:hypothetical protein
VAMAQMQKVIPISLMRNEIKREKSVDMLRKVEFYSTDRDAYTKFCSPKKVSRSKPDDMLLCSDGPTSREKKN